MPNFLESLSKARKYSIAVFAILSLSSAYLFGLTKIFAPGLRTLVDQKFLASELLTFVIFLAGLGATIRFQVASVQLFYERAIQGTVTSNGLRDGSSPKIPRIVALVLYTFGILSVAALGIEASTVIFDAYMLGFWLLITTGLFVVAIFFTAVSEMKDDYSLSYVISSGKDQLSTFPRGVFANSLVLSFYICIAIFSSYGLGLTRSKSLAVASEKCIVLVDRTMNARVLGETASGIFLIEGSHKQEKPFNLIWRFRASVGSVTFVNKDYLVSIGPSCPEPDKWPHAVNALELDEDILSASICHAMGHPFSFDPASWEKGAYSCPLLANVLRAFGAETVHWTVSDRPSPPRSGRCPLAE